MKHCILATLGSWRGIRGRYGGGNRRLQLGCSWRFGSLDSSRLLLDEEACHPGSLLRVLQSSLSLQLRFVALGVLDGTWQVCIFLACSSKARSERVHVPSALAL